MKPEESRHLSITWKTRLDLNRRETPELYEDANEAHSSSHANAIRTMLLDFGVTAVFCVQGVPTVAIVCLDKYDEQQIINLHGMLWNQGLATLLIVLTGVTVRVFTLVRKPYLEDINFVERCMVKEINAVTRAFEARNLIYSVESGRLWKESSRFFKPTERIDRVFLDNLTQSHRELRRNGMSSENAQALLIQTMFIAYLEDRQMIGDDYFLNASGGLRRGFLAILEAGDTSSLYRLFRNLKNDFNGDLFFAPCAFDPKESRQRVTRKHLATLASFRSGREVMYDQVSQLRFWGYDFKCIPIELVSSVYDRFLGIRSSKSKQRGAYYTPMFLADTTVGVIWDSILEETRTKGTFLDPACGSGLFLVKSFQRLCDHWRTTHKSDTIRWNSLLGILSRLHGCDIDRGAVRVAVFSLYVALLEEVRPPDIRRLIDKGNVLPSLWRRTLHARDFFDLPPEDSTYDVIVGNPPWTSRRGVNRSAAKWCKRHGVPMPGQESAWGFVWKSLGHVVESGVVGFILPAMAFLHNHAETSVDARKRFIQEARIKQIINFADLRFQLFERSVKPATLIVYTRSSTSTDQYRFDYLVPKADPSLGTRRVITLSSEDKKKLSSREVEKDPFVFKRRMWMSDPETKLFRYLDSYPKLGALVIEYKNVHRNIESFADHWVIGNGFIPAFESRLDESEYHLNLSEILDKVPYAPIEAFQTLAQNVTDFRPFDDGLNGAVYRKGFERAFDGPRVLVPQGISKEMKRLRASYLEEPLSFEHILLGISVPKSDTFRAKLLTSLLNTKLLLWYAFHGTGSFGSDRPIIHQSELLRLPFPGLSDLSTDGFEAAQELVAIVDEARSVAEEKTVFDRIQEATMRKIDKLCYRYFGLGQDEITLVEDTVNEVIPSTQPHSSATIELCQPVSKLDRISYAKVLTSCMKDWLADDTSPRVVLESRNDDLALLRIEILNGEVAATKGYEERNNLEIGEAIERLSLELHQKLPGNFRLFPNFRMFSGKHLWLVKPLQRRFWLRSAAITDADSIASDLQAAFRLKGSTDVLG